MTAYLFYGSAVWLNITNITFFVMAAYTFWLAPGLTQLFLYVPLVPEATVLMGFASALAGLGFMGAALVTVPSSQRMVLLLSIVGNLLNLAVHVQNVLRGYVPATLIWLALPSIAVMIVVLLLIRQDIVE